MEYVFVYVWMSGACAGMFASGLIKNEAPWVRFLAATVGVVLALLAITQTIQDNIMFALEIYLKTQ